MASTEAIELLRRHIQRFVSLNDEEWNLILPGLQEKKLKMNQLFAKEGKKAEDIAFVIEGNLRQFYINDGEEKTTYFYFENHLMSSYISCITGQPSQLALKH